MLELLSPLFKNQRVYWLVKINQTALQNEGWIGFTDVLQCTRAAITELLALYQGETDGEEVPLCKMHLVDIYSSCIAMYFSLYGPG